MDFLGASMFDGPFSPPAPSISQFTDPPSQLPFIPTVQTPNTSFVRNAYWPSPACSSPLLGSPSLANTVQDFPVHRGLRTAQVSFQRPYPYSLSTLPRNGGPAVTYQHHEAVVPYSQHVAPVRIDFNLNPVSKEKKQPPRPANAFMLFRSDFLKRKFISRDQETRQHRISIIAAKCWHRPSKEEKKKWLLEAEREKKRHALKYAGYKFQPRARTKTRREPKLAPPPHEFESLCRLADMAYQEIINDHLARENATSPSATSTSVSTLPTPPPTPQIDTTELRFLEGFREQVVRPTFFSSAAAANLLVRSAQLPYMAATISAIRDTGTMSRGVGHFYDPHVL